MSPNYELIAAIVTGLIGAGYFIGRQLGKLLSENAKNIERDLKLQDHERRIEEIEEEQQYTRRHGSG